MFISDKAETDANGIVSYKVEVSIAEMNPLVKEGFTTQIQFVEQKKT